MVLAAVIRVDRSAVIIDAHHRLNLAEVADPPGRDVDLVAVGHVIDEIVAVAAGRAAGAHDERVVARPAAHIVGPAAGDENVVAVAARQIIVPRPAEDDVVAAEAVKRIVARVAVDSVAGRGAVDQVTVNRAVEGRHNPRSYSAWPDRPAAPGVRGLVTGARQTVHRS